MSNLSFLGKLFSVLKTLNADSFRRLSDFIHSPYFKVPAASVDLFDYLQPLYPKFHPAKTSAEAIQKKAGSNLSTYRKAARAGSELLQAVEFFLALEDWQKHDLSVYWHQFNALHRAQLWDAFTSEYDKVFNRIQNDPEQDYETFFYRHNFAELASSGFDALLNRTTRNDLSPALNTLNEFYSLKLLRYMCEAVSRQQVLGTAYNEEQMNFALKTLDPFAKPENAYPYLFVNVYRMLKAVTYEMGEPHYKIIKGFISSRTGKYLPASCEESMSYAISWCLMWYGRGVEQSGNEYLWWTDFKIEKNLLLEDGKLQPIIFRNVVSLAAISNQSPEWMYRFIEQYFSYLPEEHRETNHAFGLGLYYFRTKKYTKAVQQLLIAQAKEEVLFNAIIRRWQYMCVYEQDSSDVELLINQLKAFRKYIERNKDVFKHVQPIFIPFIVFAEKLLNAAGKIKNRELQNELRDTPYFPGKPWLLEKLNERFVSSDAPNAKVKNN